jgi:hypothetical protein
MTPTALTHQDSVVVVSAGPYSQSWISSTS